jgi:putative DNA primase/helicase
LDIRGDGRGYVIAPGNPGYVLERDLPPADAPEWLLELIRPRPYVPRPSQPYAAGQHDHYVDAALRSELAALSGATTGTRGTLLNRTSFTLGTFVGAGALDRGEAEHGLFDAAHGCGLVAVDGERACRAAIRRGLDAGVKQPRLLPERDSTPPVSVAGLLAQHARRAATNAA